jgi:7-cyano-7-deazaguanine synthase
MGHNDGAMVLFSGGQDSTTCLAWALEQFPYVETVGFDYGQKHKVELECRLPILEAMKNLNEIWTEKLGEDHVVDLTTLGEISETALTKEMEIEMLDNKLPNTFVPGRNLIFLTFAAAVAYRRDLRHLVTGVCETDYSGYPDCRDDTIKAMQLALNLGMEKRFVLHTPLMWIDKAETWKLTEELGGADFIELEKEHTHTCYNGDRATRHDWGYGCDDCPACELRRSGYESYIGSKRGEAMTEEFMEGYFIRAMLPGKASRRQYRVDEIVGDQATLTEMWRQDSDRSWGASNNPQAVDISGLSGVEIMRAQAPAPGSFDED